MRSYIYQRTSHAAAETLRDKRVLNHNAKRRTTLSLKMERARTPDSAFVTDTLDTIQNFHNLLRTMVGDEAQAVQGGTPSPRRFIVDARHVEAAPKEWLEYLQSDQYTMEKIIHGQAFQAAYGRNGSAMDANLATAVNEQKTLLYSHRLSRGPWDPGDELGVLNDGPLAVLEVADAEVTLIGEGLAASRLEAGLAAVGRRAGHEEAHVHTRPAVVHVALESAAGRREKRGPSPSEWSSKSRIVHSRGITFERLGGHDDAFILRRQDPSPPSSEKGGWLLVVSYLSVSGGTSALAMTSPRNCCDWTFAPPEHCCSVIWPDG